MEQSLIEWTYDEFKHCGVDYARAETAAAYDGRHENFRDFKAEAEAIISLLDLDSHDTVIDLGCGTGGIVVYLAQQIQTLYAVDISEAMLALCRQKCQAAGLTNVTCHQGGFLSYVHTAEPVDAVISQIALHHLPDMWKQVALLRLFDLLKPGGQFLLVDVVFSFAPRDYETAVGQWVRDHVRQVGPEAIFHIKDEFSTFDWIMIEMLQRSGFVVESVQDRQSFIKAYHCRKPAC